MNDQNENDSVVNQMEIQMLNSPLKWLNLHIFFWWFVSHYDFHLIKQTKTAKKRSDLSKQRDAKLKSFISTGFWAICWHTFKLFKAFVKYWIKIFSLQSLISNRTSSIRTNRRKHISPIRWTENTANWLLNGNYYFF